MIVWDLGGVLARFRPDRRLTALAEATGLPPGAVEERIWSSGLDAEAETGRLGDDEAWTRVLDALDGRIGRAELQRCWSLAFEPDALVLALVDEVGGGALLTNNGPLVAGSLGRELHVIGRRLDPWLLSWRLGATKPDSAAFTLAAAALDHAPSDLVLVDDQAANVAAARRSGWRAVHHTDVASTRAALDGGT